MPAPKHNHLRGGVKMTALRWYACLAQHQAKAKETTRRRTRLMVMDKMFLSVSGKKDYDYFFA
jgi:hypothetical protein